MRNWCMARRLPESTATGAHKFFNEAIFQRVESDADQLAAGGKHGFCGFEAGFDLLEFVIHMDAQRLETARRRISFLVLARHRHADDVGQLARGRDWRFGALAHDSMGDAARGFFLAVII